jgi:hypothetical protein
MACLIVLKASLRGRGTVGASAAPTSAPASPAAGAGGSEVDALAASLPSGVGETGLAARPVACALWADRTDRQAVACAPASATRPGRPGALSRSGSDASAAVGGSRLPVWRPSPAASRSWNSPRQRSRRATRALAHSSSSLLPTRPGQETGLVGPALITETNRI